jgi:hypothetical protein
MVHLALLLEHSRAIAEMERTSTRLGDLRAHRLLALIPRCPLYTKKLDDTSFHLIENPGRVAGRAL